MFVIDTFLLKTDMITTDNKIKIESFRLLFFSIVTAFISYGFALTNYSLAIDSESIILPDFSMSLGRWGTNLVRYHIFHGHIPYFTMLLGLLLLSLTAVELTKLFKINGVMSYLFCALFLTFPQHSYQLVFTMQADVVPIGFLLSVLAVKYFLIAAESLYTKKSVLFLLGSALLLMFVIALYQALIIIPVVIYLILFFQKTFFNDFTFKTELKNVLYFGLLLVLGLLFYYISVKVICPPTEAGILSSYSSGDLSNEFLKNCSVWLTNLFGNWYYGNKTFIVATILTLILFIKFGIEKKHFLIRFTILFLLLILPFTFTFLISNGYHPPRIYVASGIVFAFIIVHFISTIKYQNLVLILCSVICLTNIYFITKLFYSNYQITNHDKVIAEKIDFTIKNKYPEFDENVNYVYFYGCLPYEHHQKYRLDDSEVFGGSIFNWDNGSNYRIINLFKFHDIAYYKMIDNKDVFLSIKDSINAMPIWPNKESIKKINAVIVVKLGTEKGSPLWVE